jgi:hypothetical protein
LDSRRLPNRLGVSHQQTDCGQSRLWLRHIITIPFSTIRRDKLTIKMVAILIDDLLKLNGELFFMPLSCNIEREPTSNHGFPGICDAVFVSLRIDTPDCFSSKLKEKYFA